MTDYSKRVDLEQLKGEDLKKKLETLINGSPENLFKEVQNSLIEVNEAYNESGVLEPIGSQLEEIFRVIPKAYNVSDTFKTLNHPDYTVLSDGFIVLGAEANTGKTSFMTHVMLDLIENNSDMCALVYSLDDGGTMTKKKILSQLIGVNYNKEHAIPTSRIEKREEQIINRIYVQDSITLSLLDSDIQKVKKATGCKKIFIGIDYLQIIPSPSKGGVRESLNEMVKMLKNTQKRYNDDGCILFLLSQLNRAGKEDPTPYSMNRFRETSEIENQADIALLMFNVNTDHESEDDGERKIRLAKNKKGMRGRWWNTTLRHPAYRFDPLQVRDRDQSSEAGKPGKEGKKKGKESWGIE